MEHIFSFKSKYKSLHNEQWHGSFVYILFYWFVVGVCDLLGVV